MKICDICKGEKDIKQVSLYIDETKECADAYVDIDLCAACREILADLHKKFIISA